MAIDRRDILAISSPHVNRLGGAMAGPHITPPETNDLL
jgi:hypothetical protein